MQFEKNSKPAPKLTRTSNAHGEILGQEIPISTPSATAKTLEDLDALNSGQSQALERKSFSRPCR